MKYKVGDKVRTKSIDWYNEHALIDTSGVFRTSIESLCPNKKRFMGKELTISSVLSNRHYLMEETGALRWTDEMIEGFVEEEIKPKFKVGDKITNGEITFTILRLSSDRYGAEDTFGECGSVCFKSQDEWKIVEEETKSKMVNLDDVCEWLENHDITEHIGVIYSGVCSINFDKQGLIDALCKAMED